MAPVGRAILFIEEHGVELASAKGKLPNLVEEIAGEPIKGRWWSHPKGREIYAAMQEAENSPDILVCRAVTGKISFIHRRLWLALVCLSDRFPAAQLARARQEHTPSRRHVNREIAFPEWVPRDVVVAAELMSEQEACSALGDWVR